MAETATTTAETRPFAAEVSRLLHLMVHSVYSNRDVFLRELISNAADACERLRLRALDEPGLVADDPDFRITLAADTAVGTLIVEDNGIGMDRDALVDNLGTIAKSGTRAFLDAAGDKGGALIGQFGVGFYSAFMVAREVEVFSRPVGAPEAWRWVSDGKGAFTVEPADPALAPARGTRVVLHLADDAREYAEAATVERIVAQYSAHVPVPVVFRIADETKTLADGSALWRKPKASITPADYAEFYHHVSGQYDDPAVTLHFRAEGRQEYSALLFLPSVKPLDLFHPERKGRIKLYVRRVLITDDVDILPPWLRFVRGVIDSEDLPLNLSREMLQTNPILTQIGKGATNRLLGELERIAKDDPDTFAKLWDSFGAVIKEGLYEEPSRRDALLALARFKTTTSGESLRSLADYVAALRPNQTAIYYALGASREAILASPQLEGFARRGIEVLILADPVDAFWVRTALGFDGKPFQSVTQGAADLAAIPASDDATAAEAAADRPTDSAIAVLIARMKQALGDRVSDIRPSQRLSGSPVCLVAHEAAADLRLERLLAGHESAPPRRAPILEVNPDHALIAALATRAATGGDAASAVDDAAFVLLAEARILDGERPDDPADFARRLDRLLARSLG